MKLTDLLSALLLVMPLLAGQAASAAEVVDLIVHDARILTLDQAGTRARTMAVRDGQIVALGDAALLKQYTAERTVDLDGRTVMPGFIDSHTHISGNPPWYIPLEDVRSVAEIRARVAAKAAELEPGAWITGYGWSEDALAEQRRPLIGDLDAAAPDNPVVLTRAGGHSAVGSSLAFELAGIDAASPDPDRGVIERDADGALNGIIRERQDLLIDLVPEADDALLRPSLIANLQDLFAHGITSIVQASDSIEHFAEWETVYAAHRGDLPRAAVQVAWEGPEAMAAFGRKSGDGDAHLRLGAIKIFADGGFTGPAAYTSEPYKGEDSYRGKLNMSPETLRRTIREAHDAGWQLGIHAIGDAAIELTVDALVEALGASPRPDHRHYLNHFTVMPDQATMEAMAEHHIAITQQPNFTYTLEGRYVDNLDGRRLETNNPLRTPLDHGIHLAISSDILPIGPAVGLYAAVTRRGMSGRVFGPEERIGIAEALRAYTVDGAWLTREEDLKGSLEAGKLADFIVLAADPLALPGDELRDLEVLETWLGGRRVYVRTPSPPGGADTATGH
ncbi:MAG: amidohydrolase family protein [Gammaproteobacteria bacterium]|jgi:predicted amidohydrolase YtcJ|nr:amidohydrolase family protein [Gammaproteobacteria bacterium]